MPHGDKKANWDLLSPIVSMTGAPSEPFCLNSRLDEIDLLASAGKLVEAAITAEGLSISPIRKGENDESDDVARRIYGMLPRLRITELLAEVNGWTGFAERFVSSSHRRAAR